MVHNVPKGDTHAVHVQWVKIIIHACNLPMKPRVENSSISHSFVTCWSANVLMVEAKLGVATKSSSS